MNVTTEICVVKCGNVGRFTGDVVIIKHSGFQVKKFYETRGFNIMLQILICEHLHDRKTSLSIDTAVFFAE